MTSEGSPSPARKLPRGTVTLFFTDVEEATAGLRRLGDRYGVTLDLHGQVLADAIRASGGVVVDTQGDSLFAVFTRAFDAVAAAVDAQRRLAAVAWPEDVPLAARGGGAGA